MSCKEYDPISDGAAKNSDQIPVVVVMVPLPAQGHLNQLLHLSHLLSTFNIPVHFVGAATHNRQAKHRSHMDPNTPIQFHDMETLPFPSPPPDPNAPNKFPSQLIPSFTAAAKLHVAPFLHSLKLTAKRLVVIHDSLMSSAVDEGAWGDTNIPNAEWYCFHSVSAFAIALHCLERGGNKYNNNNNINNVETAAFYEECFPRELNVAAWEGCFPAEFMEFIELQFGRILLAAAAPELGGGKIYNSCRVIEGRFLDVIQKLQPHFHHWPLGPFNPLKISPSLQSSSDHSCLAWLDKQEPRSVIYVSFGTTTAMQDQQIKEIAIGLARSRQNFIWVLRDADTGDIFAGVNVRKMELPKGYEKMIGDRGLVIREWAPQLKILNHEATGGFMTHCGWNSCMETITAGVPVAAWPMHSDQPRNTVLMTTVLQVGLVVREWSPDPGEVVAAAAVEQAVTRLMVSEEGAEMRRTAEKLGEAVRHSVEDGGDSRRELEAFVAHIRR